MVYALESCVMLARRGVLGCSWLLRRSIVLLAVGALFAPGLAVAQPPPAAPSAAASEPVPLQSSAPVPPQPGASAAASGTAPVRAPWHGTTIALQSVGGILGGVVIGGAGGLVGALALGAGDSTGWGALGGLLVGMAAGMSVGTGVGVAIVGDRMAGTGRWPWTIVGSVVGSFAGMALLVSRSSENAAGAFIIGGLLGGSAGGIVGYHLSAQPVGPAAALLVPDGSGLRFGVPAWAPCVDVRGRWVGATATVLGFGF